MRIKILLVVFLATSVSLVTQARAQACNTKQFDMLDWMAPQAGTSNGHFNVVYPTEGKFYWVKGAAGFPWDVDNFDKRYIYQSITEQVWNDPTTYKIFQQALPWMPRCIAVPATLHSDHREPPADSDPDLVLSLFVRHQLQQLPGSGNLCHAEKQRHGAMDALPSAKRGLRTGEPDHAGVCDLCHGDAGPSLLVSREHAREACLSR